MIRYRPSIQRLRHALRDYFPAALEAFDDLAAADTLVLLTRAPDPSSAARLTTAQISAALKQARRRGIPGKAAAIVAALRAEHLSQPEGRHCRLCRDRARPGRCADCAERANQDP